MTERVDAVELIPHNLEEGYHMWTYLPGYQGVPATIKLDNLGRRNKRAWRDWLVLICNNTECTARCAVRVESVTDIAERFVPVSKGVSDDS